MKNSLLIPVVFLANLVVWVCSIALFSVLGVWRYLDAVSSGNFQLFFVMSAWRAVYILPVGIVLALITTFFFLMRHRSIPFISIPFVLAITAASVVVLIPLSYRAGSFLETRFPFAIKTWGRESPNMSDFGYIREDPSGSGRMWVDLAESPDSERKLLVADTLGDEHVLSFTQDALYDSESRSLVSGSGSPIVRSGGEDPLYIKNMAAPRFLLSLLRDTSFVIDAIHAGYRESLVGYFILAGSFFIAIVSLWCLSMASSWRMLNVFLVLASVRGLFLLWPASSSGIIARTATKFLPALISSGRLVPALYLAISALVLVVSGSVFLLRKIRHVKAGVSYE
jgi:hypothetical protein